MAVIDSKNSKLQGIFDDVKEFWQQGYPKYAGFEQIFCKRPKDSTVQSASYGWKESVDFPSYWEYGKGRKERSFRDRLIEVGLHGYELKVSVNSYDRRSDQLEDPKTHIERGIKRFHQIPIKFIADFLNGTPNLIPELTLAYDGQNLFSTTADGAARFGVTDGNLKSASGFTAQSIYNDVFRAQQQFLNMKDPSGEPIFDEEDVSFENMVAIVPPHLNEVALTAAKAKFFRNDTTSTVASDNILSGTFQVKLFNQLSDSSSWFVVLEHPWYKPFLLRQESSLRNFWADMSNSDVARETNKETLFADQRVGMGILCPFVIIKFNA